MKKLKKTFLLLFFLALTLLAYAQDSIHVQPSQQRIKAVAYGGAALYGVGMTGLGVMWYADQPTRSFHFLNDGGAWYWVDKWGHAYATYQVARTVHASLRWADMPERKATWWAAGSAWLALTSIEVFDGFSEGWGASPSDALANLAGVSLWAGQQLLWNEERIRFRWSYANHENYPQYRPDALGSNAPERWLKDYNGQVYWLATSPAAWLPQTRFPKWLGIAVGYSADGILGAYENPTTVDGLPIPPFERRWQVYLAPDIFLDEIKTRSKFLNTLFFLAGSLKFPLPALEYTQGAGWKWYSPF